MKKSITTLLTLFVTYCITAQEIKSVESIYDNYMNAIGGKDKIKAISNIKQYEKSYGSTHIKHNYGGKTTETDVETNIAIIYFDDLSSNQKVFLSKNGDYITKLIGYDGKTFIEDSKGKQTEIENNDTEQQSTVFIGSQIKPNSKVSLGVYNSEDVYIVQYGGKKIMTNIVNVDFYEFFSVKTGLLLAIKQVTIMEKNAQSTMIIEFSDYKEVQGILIPHTKYGVITTTTDYGVTDTKTNTIIITEFNIDKKDFQENCFKKPEKCFKNYSSK